LGKARERPPFLLPQPFCCPVDLGLGKAGGGDQDGKGGHAWEEGGEEQEHRGSTGERTAVEAAYRCRAWSSRS
jgi:hypothetical protein